VTLETRRVGGRSKGRKYNRIGLFSTGRKKGRAEKGKWTRKMGKEV